jgi:hypothetical protein
MKFLFFQRFFGFAKSSLSSLIRFMNNDASPFFFVFVFFSFLFFCYLAVTFFSSPDYMKLGLEL